MSKTFTNFWLKNVFLKEKKRKKNWKKKFKEMGGRHCKCRGTEYGCCPFVLTHSLDFYASSSLMWPIHYVLRRPRKKQTKWEPLIVSLGSPPESRGKFLGYLWTWPLISYSHPQASDSLASSKESLAGKSCHLIQNESSESCLFVKILLIFFLEKWKGRLEREGKKHQWEFQPRHW